MAETLLGWAGNIIYYMIFLSLAEHLLAGNSYGRYLRLFGGMVLVLIVLGPFASSVDLESRISRLFHQFTFRQESEELKKELFGMEEKRLADIRGQYRKNVEEEIQTLAEKQGVSCSKVQVHLEENRQSPFCGQILGIEIELSGTDLMNDAGSERENLRSSGPALSASAAEDRPVSVNRIEIAPERTKECESIGPTDVSERQEQAAALLKGKAEQYYGLEGEAVKIKWKND